MTHLLSAGRWF